MNHVVVVDTMVFGASLAGRGPIAGLYDKHLVGRALVVSAQTVAEMRFGALKAGWRDARLQQLEARIRTARVAPVDDDTAWAYARLRDACIKAGHGLGDKVHDGDRWIAATALRFGIPLVSHDGIFADTPGLKLITEL